MDACRSTHKNYVVHCAIQQSFIKSKSKFIDWRGNMPVSAQLAHCKVAFPASHSPGSLRSILCRSSIQAAYLGVQRSQSSAMHSNCQSTVARPARSNHWGIKHSLIKIKFRTTTSEKHRQWVETSWKQEFNQGSSHLTGNKVMGELKLSVEAAGLADRCTNW